MNRKVNTCLALLVFLLLFALQGHATNLLTNGMLTGNITDKSTGKPIYGASIYIPDQRIGGASDASGHFIIEHISTGIHLVEVSHVGYETLLIYVDGEYTTCFWWNNIHAIIWNTLFSFPFLIESQFYWRLLPSFPKTSTQETKILSSLPPAPMVQSAGQ